MSPRPISQPWLNEAIGTAEWTGTPLRGVLEEAGLRDSTREILFTGLDRGIQGGKVQYYQRSLSVEEACRDEVLLAWGMNSEPLPPQHGYPLRLVVPGWYGMTSVKWLDRIEAIREPFAGYQMDAYRYRDSADDPGRPVELQQVRALMIPPGIPDFLTRTRVLESGLVRIEGRAWAGRNEVRCVEVSVDGGANWKDAVIGDRVSQHSWWGWSFDWEATPGRYTLCVRAADSDGNIQPTESRWNHHGMGNNAVQCVEVFVDKL
jgi:DMSO/TMAO reductase YedYZ molybdopterin-dependent catalytic subunit